MSGLSSNSAGVQISDLDCHYESTHVVKQLSLATQVNSITCILGPSGCGKSTLLRTIAGFHQASNGNIAILGQIVAGSDRHVAVEKRQIGWVSQDLGLFPHLSVSQNIGFGSRQSDKQTRNQEIQRLLDLIGLSSYGTHMPHELSGGQQQRVAIARALASRPSLLLLDEPFSGLDRQLRQQMGNELVKLLKQEGLTAIMVTHDQDEAFAISDSMAVMCEGRIHQFGQPGDIYRNPASPFVAEFVGVGSWLELNQLDDRQWTSAFGGSYQSTHNQPDKLKIRVRPEHIRIDPDQGTPMTVIGHRFIAGVSYCLLDHPQGQLICRRPETGTSTGDSLPIRINILPEFVFSAA